MVRNQEAEKTQTELIIFVKKTQLNSHDSNEGNSPSDCAKAGLVKDLTISGSGPLAVSPKYL